MARARFFALIVSLAFAGCSSPEPGPTPEPVAQDTTGAETAAPVYDFGIEVSDVLRVGGQPTEEDLAAAAAAGVTTVVSLRTDGEPGSEGERDHVGELGMRFVSIPVAGPDDLTAEKAQQLDEALSGSEGPVLLHCGSGNRAGSLLGLRAYVSEGATGDEALAVARGAGMTHLEDALRAELTELCADEPARCPGRQDEVEESEDVVPAGPAPE